MKRWVFCAKIVFSIVLFYVLYRAIDWSIFAQGNIEFVWPMLILLILIMPLSLFARVYRFYVLINHHKHQMSLWDVCKLTLVGESLNIVLPASSGDLLKAAYGYKKHNIKEEMISITLFDKIVGLLGLLLLGSITAILQGLQVLGTLFVIATTLLAIAYFIPKVIPWSWIDVLQKKKMYVESKKLKSSLEHPLKTKTVVLLYSVLAWVVTYVQLFIISKLFGLKISFGYLFATAPVINLSRLLPISWAGLGVQEGTTVYLFNSVGVLPAISVLVSLVFTLTITFIPGLIGAYFLLREKYYFG